MIGHRESGSSKNVRFSGANRATTTLAPNVGVRPNADMHDA